MLLSPTVQGQRRLAPPLFSSIVIYRHGASTLPNRRRPHACREGAPLRRGFAGRRHGNRQDRPDRFPHCNTRRRRPPHSHRLPPASRQALEGRDPEIPSGNRSEQSMLRISFPVHFSKQLFIPMVPMCTYVRNGEILARYDTPASISLPLV